jgi:serine/threonine protein kinase/WD40 repeat protein
MPTWNPQANDLFLRAAEIESADERREFLDRECGGDRELRRQVESLLAASEKAGSFLEKPALNSDTPTLPPVTEGPGTTVGHYKLLQQLGEGGMGVVYMAEQTEPVRRKVALKIIKPGMDTKQVIARFEAERQTLAMMEHQNIARVLDAGTTDSGRPYFVMELVKGVPITQYCDHNKLTVRERLELFRPVCQAIQHAHQKGIIHRDIKPSNVLVCLYDGKPVPKVIDFGVAKAIDQRLTERTLFTQYGQVVGTLEYMSPEQAELSQLDIDTRSDIYSLGVLLYELLTGTTPITKEKLREAAFLEILRSICEDEPERPSTRLSHSGDALPNISAQRKTEPKKLGALVRGELDWIVMKSLEKDRTRRYETASALAADVERYLKDEAVQACPPSTVYRLRKFARKHRAALVSTAAFAALLIAGVVVSTWQAVRATRAQAQARASAEQARRNEQQARAAASAESKAKEAEADQRKLAERRRQQAVEAFEGALDQLSQSLFQNARTLLASDQHGRRWATLEMLRGAEGLRIRQGVDSIDELLEPNDATERMASALALHHLAELAGTKPAQSDLRTQAVAALLTRDGHVVREWPGIAHSVSPDGTYAASLVVDLEQNKGEVVIHDLMSGTVVHRWEGKEAMKIGGTGIALGPQAQRLASLAMDMRSVNVWQLPQRTLVRKLSLPKAPADAPSDPPTDAPPLKGLIPFETLHPAGLSFSPNGRFVAGITISLPTARVVVWDLEDDRDGGVTSTIPMGNGEPRFSPDSRLLAFASEKRKVTLWNVAEERIEQELELPLAPTGWLTFTPDGRLAVRCYGAGETPSRQATGNTTLVVWDIDRNQEAQRIALDASSIEGGIRFSPDGSRAAVADHTGQIAVYDTAGKVDPVKLDHGPLPLLLAWRRDGGHLLSGSMGSLNMWQFADDPPVSQLSLDPNFQPQAPAQQFVFSPDGRFLAVGGADPNDTALFDCTSGEKIRTFADEETGWDHTQQLAFTPDSKQLIRFTMGALTAWDVDTAEQRVRFQPDVSERHGLFSVGVRADGRIIISGLSDYKPAVWITGEDAPVWRGDSRGALTAVSPDGRLVAVFSSSFARPPKPTVVYDLATGQQRFELASSVDPYQLLGQGQFSPDSRWLLVFDWKGFIATSAFGVISSTGGAGLSNLARSSQDQPWSGMVWNVATGERHLELAGSSNPITYAFSPNGKYLAVAQRNGMVQLWDVDGAQKLFEWLPPGRDASQPVFHLAFTADSTQLAVADPSSPALHLMDLTRLQKDLAEYGLGW